MKLSIADAGGKGAKPLSIIIKPNISDITPATAPFLNESSSLLDKVFLSPFRAPRVTVRRSF